MARNAEVRGRKGVTGFARAVESEEEDLALGGAEVGVVIVSHNLYEINGLYINNSSHVIRIGNNV